MGFELNLDKSRMLPVIEVCAVINQENCYKSIFKKKKFTFTWNLFTENMFEKERNGAFGIFRKTMNFFFL